MAKPGRNEACACGSGKKSKRCCEGGEAAASPRTRMLIVLAGAALAAAIVAGIMSDRDDGAAGAGRVWSPEHGHYHDR